MTPAARPAILVAAYNMKPDVVNALLELGAPVDIFEASVLGKVDRIQEILKANPARVSEHAPDGFTPVALAAFFGQPAAVKALIAAGADVNAAATNRPEGSGTSRGGRRSQPRDREGRARGRRRSERAAAGRLPANPEAGTNANRALAELLIAHGADPSLPSTTARTRSIWRATRATRVRRLAGDSGPPDHPQISPITQIRLLVGRP